MLNYDGRDPLPKFNATTWAKGVFADIYGYDPSARDINDDPIIEPVLVGELRYNPKRHGKLRGKVKPKRGIVITPKISRLVEIEDAQERTVEEHRQRVEKYYDLYKSGIDPLTGKSLKDVKSFEYYEDDESGDLVERDEYIAINEFKVSQKVKKADAKKKAAEEMPERRPDNLMQNEGIKTVMRLWYEAFKEDN